MCMVWAVGESPPDIQVVSDAAKLLGLWGTLVAPLVFPAMAQSKSIQVLEHIPVVIAAAIFGKE